jgi:hypothetical protein
MNRRFHFLFSAWQRKRKTKAAMHHRTPQGLLAVASLHLLSVRFFLAGMICSASDRERTGEQHRRSNSPKWAVAPSGGQEEGPQGQEVALSLSATAARQLPPLTGIPGSTSPQWATGPTASALPCNATMATLVSLGFARKRPGRPRRLRVLAGGALASHAEFARLPTWPRWVRGRRRGTGRCP